MPAHANALPTKRSDRMARAFVYSVWTLMAFVALLCLVRYGRNIPLVEDWFLVRALTGNEPDLIAWLWSQNNEHRIPLPRIVLLGLLRLTNGDFRVGMLFDVAVLSALSFAMIQVARSLRGRTRFADAFFAIAMLHLGNWENLFWGWQLSFVLSVVLICTLLLALANRRALAEPRNAVVAGVCLVLLPLCGGTGLLFVPPLAAWLSYLGIHYWRTAEGKSERKRLGALLTTSAMAALTIAALYFVGYERPSWTPPNPGIGPSLRTAAQFLALSFGPVARALWWPPMIAALSLLASAAVLIARGILRHNGVERQRACGMLVFLISMLGFAAAMGWGRAGVIAIYGTWPLRYVLLAVPVLCVAFFAWEIYGHARLRAVVQGSLFAGMLLLLPFNTAQGFRWRDWYVPRADAVEQDIATGTSCYGLARNHRDFLLHPATTDELAKLACMLREAKIEPFADLTIATKDQAVQVDTRQVLQKERASPPDIDGQLVAQEIRYDMPEAGEVFLVWGIDGWTLMPEEMRPSGTVVENGAMHTPMIRDGDTFSIKVFVPSGTKIEYSFLITKQRDGTPTAPLWDDQPDYELVVAEEGIAQIEPALTLAPDGTPISVIDTPLVTREIRYHEPKVCEVFLVWGINGWMSVPQDIRPVGTQITDQAMRTPMAQEGDTFVAQIQVPIGASLDYGFWITKRCGLLAKNEPTWEGGRDPILIVEGEDTIEVAARRTLPQDLVGILRRNVGHLALLGAFLLLWALFYLVPGFLDGS